MGSPLGPTFANIFMSVLEIKFMANCPSESKPSRYCTVDMLMIRIVYFEK